MQKGYECAWICGIVTHTDLCIVKIREIRRCSQKQSFGVHLLKFRDEMGKAAGCDFEKGILCLSIQKDQVGTAVLFFVIL